MNADAFERFEKSRGGLLIPVVVFVLGAIATVVAMIAVQRVALDQAAAQQQLQPPAADARGAPESPNDDATADAQNHQRGPAAP